MPSVIHFPVRIRTFPLLTINRDGRQYRKEPLVPENIRLHRTTCSRRTLLTGAASVGSATTASVALPPNGMQSAGRHPATP